MMTISSRGWADVDQVSDPTAFIDYLDTANTLDVVRRIKTRTYALLDIQLGHQILDIGCGAGDDVRAMAELVGPTGQAVGIDISNVILDVARTRSTGTGLPVEFVHGDVHHLDLPDDAFDGCRADRTFHHLDDPEQALREMIRVARPGGRIVTLDPIWDMQIIEGADVNVSRRIIHYRCDHRLKQGRIAARLPALFRRNGLTDVVVIPDTGIITDWSIAEQMFELREIAAGAREVGVITAAEAERWLADLERAGQTGELLCAGTSFTVAGRKPA